MESVYFLSLGCDKNLSDSEAMLGLLEKAGYSLSHSILFDIIVEYCILQGNYNIFEINELLFQNDKPLLGG